MMVLALDGDDMRDAALNLRPFALGLAGLAAVLLTLWWLLRASSSPTVAELRIEAPLERVGTAHIEAELQPWLKESFLALRLDAARDALAQLPWVARARVERVWPGALRVRIWERKPFARWNDDSLIDTESQVFTPRPEEMPPNLPQLGGVAGHQREVMETFKRLGERLDATPFALVGLREDARGEWTGRTRDGIELRFGRGVPDDKLEMLLGAALTKLAEELPQVDHIDLRYTNGFAVGWRSQPANSGSENNG